METSDRARSSPYRHRRWLAPLAAVVALAAATTLYGMGSAQAATTTLTVGTTQGPALHDDFIGLSFEAAIIAQPALSGGNLAQYMKTLGPGVARFGGNFVDTTFWTSKGEKAPSWAVTTLTPGDLKRLKTLATDSGWKVILGVNLKHRDPARAADEAKFAQQILGSSLYGIEVGNEPNYYTNYTPAKFWADFQAYKAAIARSAPGVGLVGPSPGRVPAADAWLKDFADRESGHVDIAAFSGHYYPACAKNTPKPTVTSLLSTAYRDTEKTRADLVAGLAGGLGVPGILDEGNSVSCEGTDGVSDVFASALWGVDAQLLYAQEGLKGFYLHSAVAKCGAAKPLYKAYTPFCAATDADAAAGKLQARPVYYSSLLLQQLGTATFAPVSNNSLSKLRAYALRDGDQLKLVLVNVTASALSTSVHMGQSYSSGSSVALTAPSLTSKTGITFGGHFVGKDGTFAGVTPASLAVSGSSLTMNLPAASATVVTLNP